MGTFLMLVGFIVFCWGLGSLFNSFLKKRRKKKNVIVLVAAFAVMIFGSFISPTSNYSDSSRETAHSEKKIATKNDSSEAKKEKKETERKAKEKKQKQEADRKAKEEKEQKQEADRKAKQEQAEINQKVSEATAVLAQAEATPTRENYNVAAASIQAIPKGNQDLSNRLAAVDATIKANEAAEAERQRQAAAQEQEKQAAEAQRQAEQQNNSYSMNGQWFIAANGMVFARSDSGKYYSRVTNPNNYQYMAQIDADNAGYIRAPRGNQYARP